GTVNTNVAGLYQRTYTVSDPNGNSRTMVRSVLVQPPLSLVLTGNNPTLLECHPATFAGRAAVFGSPLGIVAGSVDSFAIKPTRAVSGWGYNTAGQLNIPSSVDRKSTRLNSVTRSSRMPSSA